MTVRQIRKVKKDEMEEIPEKPQEDAVNEGQGDKSAMSHHPEAAEIQTAEALVQSVKHHCLLTKINSMIKYINKNCKEMNGDDDRQIGKSWIYQL